VLHRPRRGTDGRSGYLYCEEELGRCSVNKRLNKDKARRRIAVNFAKLPKLLRRKDGSP
jgi:hypothetical protein